MMLRFVVISAMLMLAACGGKVGGGVMDSVGGWMPQGWGWGKDRGERVVLINTFIVPAGKTDEAMAMWQKAREFMREQDGYISTRLHLSIDENARYRLVNIARWQSAGDFRAAAKALRQSGIMRPIDGVRGNPHLYKVIRRGRK